MDKLEIYNEREKKSFEIDLKPDSSVSLQLKSNLFSPIDKITLNHSFTIQAPDTLQNRRAFGMGNQVAVDSDQVRQKFPCKFYRNGVHILTGTCHVQAIENSSFSLLLVWGLDVMEALKEGGDLQDLDLGNMRFEKENFNDEGKPVPDYNTYAEAMAEHMFFAHSVGDFAKKNEYNLSATDQFTPCIAARTLFKKCLESSGIAYEVDEDAFEFMKRLAVPLPTLDSGKLNVAVSGSGRVSDKLENIFANPSGLGSHFFVSGFNAVGANVTVTDGHTFGTASQCDMSFDVEITCSKNDPERALLCVVEYDDGGKVSSREYKRMVLKSGETKDGIFVFSYEKIELSPGGKSEFYFIYKFPWVEVETDPAFSVTVKNMAVEYKEPPITAGMELSISANLPKLSKINYVKALCQICGIFPIPPVDGSSIVRFVAPGILEKNKINAVDWSGYVNGEPKKINFAFSDFAQNNLITYKDGEKHAASFTMESPTADKEKTAFELPFMHLIGGRWPLWSVEYDKDKKVYEWKRENADPAIFYLNPFGADETTDAYLSFDEVAPAAILKRWEPLSNILRRAKVVQVELMLPQTAVKYADYSVPVYIEQLGGYFGIVSLTNAGNKTTAELIKI